MAGTTVLMADETRKPIEEVEVGDAVLATDPATGLTRPEPVVGTTARRNEEPVVEITMVAPASGLEGVGRLASTNGGGGAVLATVTATDNHPIWIAGRRAWVDADAIRPGDMVYAYGGGMLPVIRVVANRGGQVVYNLTVARAHTYYVLAANASMLVHNTSCGKPVNLPGWRRVDVDMAHVLRNHTAGGSGYRQSGLKDKFPDFMSPSFIQSSIKQAYRNSSIAGRSQGDRVFLRGEANGLVIEMWLNKSTRTIETAYPVGWY